MSSHDEVSTVKQLRIGKVDGKGKEIMLRSPTPNFNRLSVYSKETNIHTRASKSLPEAQISAPVHFVLAWKFLAVALASFVVYKFSGSYNSYKCYLEQESQLNLTKINEHLTLIVGQKHTKNELQSLLTDLNENTMISILCGPQGVGKSMTASVVYKSWPSQHKFLLAVPLLSEVGKLHNAYTNVLNKLSCCGRNLIVIENLEYLVQDQIQPFTEFINMVSSINPVCPSRKILILMTTADGDEVIESEKSKEKSFEDTTYEVRQFFEADPVYSQILESSTVIIPFYPLGKEEVEECFSRVEKDQAVIGRAMKRLEYYKVGDAGFVNGGCRKVGQLLNNEL